MFTGLNLIFGLVLIVSKSERGQISESLGLVLHLSPPLRRPPLPYISRFKKCTLHAQISEILKLGGISSAALRKLEGELSFALTSTMGTVDRMMLRPFYFQSNSDVEFPARLPSCRAALEWRCQALSVWDPWSLRSLMRQAPEGVHPSRFTLFLRNARLVSSEKRVPGMCRLGRQELTSFSLSNVRRCKQPSGL